MTASRLVLGVALMLGPLSAPSAAGGQTLGHVYRVGIILPGGPYHVLVDGLRQGLRELGLEEGKHFVLDIRDREGDLKGVEEEARDLERGKVDLIYTVTTSVTMAAKRATTSSPSSSTPGPIRSRSGWWRASRSRAGG